MAADGRTAPVQVTRSGGMAASESPDRRFLYYSKSPVSPTTIWRVPASGGEEEPVAEGLSYSLNFTLGERGLYFVSLADEAHLAFNPHLVAARSRHPRTKTRMFCASCSG